MGTLADDDTGAIKLDGPSIETYIENATGKDGDTKEARLLGVFYALKSEPLDDAWHRIPGLRAFLQAHYLENPLIPDDLRKIWEDSRSRRQDAAGFLQDWEKEMGKITPLMVNPHDFLDTIEVLPEEKEKFVKNNLHDHSYFFLKYAEWHVTREYQKKLKAPEVVDIGAAYHGFARTLCAIDPDVTVTMVDMVFDAGKRERFDRIYEIGADAAYIPDIPDSSIKLICSHNAFEHFAGDSDMKCIQEIDRILEPGGVALIAPLFISKTHSVTISPAPCFLFEPDDSLANQVREELEQTGGRLDFNPNIISPFARRYDIKTFKERIQASAPNLKFALKSWTFKPKVDKLGLHDHPEVTVDADVFHKRHFYFLEISKP